VSYTSAPVKYPYHSLLATEIAQQADLWPGTLERVNLFLADRPIFPSRVVFTGAGTSFYAAESIAAAWPGARAISTTDLLLLSVEEVESAVPGMAQEGMLVSLGRSGDSPESEGVVRRLQALFPAVRHLAITCNPGGRLAHLQGVDVIVLDPRTNDRSLAMTASFSNLTLAGLALCHAGRIQAGMDAVAQHTREQLESMFAVASEMAAVGSDRWVVLTSAMHSLALEATLKVLELKAGRIYSFADSFLGFRHGPISLLREDTVVLCVLSNDPYKLQYEKDVVVELQQRGVQNVCLIGHGPEAKSLPHRWFVSSASPSLPDSLRTPFEIVFAQLFAYACSLRCGVDPDNPSPNGEVTRVVRPFSLHV
jgi:tagatose-6-phosphate ketose/aldose isomerase